MRKPRAKKPRAKRERRPPAVAYELLIESEHPEIYERVKHLVAEHHDELENASIAVAWCTSWRVNVDGQQRLGMCRRASDLDRELALWDFVILLNREFYEHEETTPLQRDALLDHELMHATTRDDPDTGEPMKNAKGKIIYRIRKHDVEEFAAIAQRYGLWKQDLERFAAAIARRSTPRLPMGDEDQSDGRAHAQHTQGSTH